MPDESIKDPNYQENPEQPDKEQWVANIEQFKGTGHLLWPLTRTMYEVVKEYCVKVAREHPQFPKFIWKPKICDIGCGAGIGANIMSQEADLVWGIDKNVNSIKFANEAFARIKNNIYWSPQVSFDVIDFLTDEREFGTFDIVSCIETIEHINDYGKLFAFIKKLCKKDKQGNYPDPPLATTIFISTPNRNSPKIQKDRPKNPYHVREWTAGEFYELLTKHFKYVTLMNWKGDLVDGNTEDTPILCKVEIPL